MTKGEWTRSALFWSTTRPVRLRTITTRHDEDGASAVEHGLLVAGIAALIVAIGFLFGGVIRAPSRAPAG